jgi:hypothetical protein
LYQTSVLPSGITLNSICVQNLPNALASVLQEFNGTSYLPFVVGTFNRPQLNSSSLRFVPQTGYVGAVCFDAFLQLNNTSGPSMDTNVVTIEMKIGGSTASCSSQPNQAPTTSNQSITIKKSQSAAFAPISGADPDGNTPITFTHSAFPLGLGCVESNSGQIGNIITCTPDLSLPTGVYSFTLTPKDGLNLSGTPATYTVNVENPENVIIDLSKSKADGNITVQDNVTIQIDVKNPNSFALTNVTTDITIDPTKVNLVSNSGKEGIISGSKFSALEYIKKLFVLDAQAASGAVISYPNSTTMRVFLSSIPANTSYSYIFDVTTQSTGVGIISGTSTVQGLSLPNVLDQTSINVNASTTQTVLPRTGGSTLNFVNILLGTVILMLLGLIPLFKVKNKRNIRINKL